ncbi:glycosyltransferase family 8 protein [Ancylobacter sp. MQZ15Z-1]|uniref:Glycosyltransferase family 8 protein n=1 Tax=Ancylobacter mangrovi TaxID=2972472 RepID=A0A9X2PD16_9HYPH|nr:glycosyltransferase family 8 protein [Ancylobacter mangrovi]MCS0493725.1 glycosyltransferase family 8 protein [Ancylobacter mangrovi]
MIVATATDTAYVELTAVLLASLAEQAGPGIDAVYVFCDGVSPANKERLRLSYGREGLAFIDLTDAMGAFSARPVNHHLSRTAYARILMPLTLADVTGRLLYIDCDTLVNGSLAPLAEIDMQGHALAAVDDIAIQVPERHAKRNLDIGMPADMRYFNSGVLLIDLEEWRRQRVSERVIEFVDAHPELPMMDQDALNGTLRGDWLALDERWNMHRRLKKGRYVDDPSIWQDARIIHFIGQIKPNYSDCGHPARTLYFEHRARTPFANAPVKTKLGRKVEKRVRRLKRLFGRVRRAFGS